MDKAFEANVSTTTAPAAGTAIGYPSDGDPTTGTPPTTPGAGWFWAVTAELLALIVGAGLTPNAGVLTQVRDAVIAIATARASAVQTTVLGWFTGSNVSLTSPGWRKLPGGDIEMWGMHTNSSDSEVVTFPTMTGASQPGFPNACLNVMMTLNEANGASSQNIGATELTQTGFTAFAGGQERPFFWRAIGF